MFVEVTGMVAGEPLTRTWTLLAEGDDGPFIPSMAVAALVLKTLGGDRRVPGARHAAMELTLDDYQPLFEARAISTGFRGLGPKTPSLYSGLLEDAFAQLPGPVRAVHEAGDGAIFEGQAQVDRGRGPMANLIAAVVGFPKAGKDVPLRVAFSVQDGVETWTRTFGDQVFSSTQEAGGGLFCTFNSMGRCTKWGSWGVLEYADQEEKTARAITGDGVESRLQLTRVANLDRTCI